MQPTTFAAKGLAHYQTELNRTDRSAWIRMADVIKSNMEINRFFDRYSSVSTICDKHK